MSIEEAIKGLHTLTDRISLADDRQDAIAMAIKSLEKEIPRMVNYEGDGYADGYMVYDMAECPACGNRMTEDNDDIWDVATYCPECGQRIIWEAEDEAD